jgi:tetratricopeptide (TPR) repeat protein
MLVVLDNAHSVEQVRPLLPGTPSCCVLVTSRDSLAGLVARYGAHRVDVDLLPPGEAVGLLRALVGGRVDAEPDEAAALAERCVRLPLALRLAAELALARPDMTLAGLVAELTDEQRRLDLLDAGNDPRSAIRAVFSWSYRHLPADKARMFRLLGLHPGHDIDVYAVAALAGADVIHTTQLITALVRAHLVHEANPGRFGMHDLLRAYATERAAQHDTEPDRRAALTRLFDHYRYTAAAATDTLFPAEGYRRPRIAPPSTPTPQVSDVAQARVWLDAERPNLVAAVAYTADHGWPTHTAHLAVILRRYLNVCGHYTDALIVHTQALRVARGDGDRAGEAMALHDLGEACRDWIRHNEALDHLQKALTIRREVGDRLGEARTLNALGMVYQRWGCYGEALGLYQRSLAIRHEVGGDRVGEARTLDNLGLLYGRRGCYDDALDHLQKALTITREIGDGQGEAVMFSSLGLVYGRQGCYDEALDHLQKALTITREMGVRRDEAQVLNNLGLVYGRRGCYNAALDHLQKALIIARTIGTRYIEIQALNGLGETHRAAGRTDDALNHHQSALVLARQIDDRDEQARAHDGIARTLQATGRPHRARQHWRDALTLYSDLGVPEADEIRAHLAVLDGQVAAKPS